MTTSLVLTEEQCRFIINSIDSHFYIRIVEEDGEFVWKKPPYITFKELMNIITDAMDGPLMDQDDGYMG